MTRRPRCLVLSALLAVPSVMLGQSANPNQARILSTPSPAALGQPVDLSLGLSTANDNVGGVAVGDLAVGPGALRVMAWHPAQYETYGVGYAAPFMSRMLARGLSTTVGGEVALGYYGTRYPRNTLFVGNATSVNAHFSLPISLQVGSPRYLSLTPYVAPYVETGLAPTGYWQPAGCVSPACGNFVYSGHYRTSAIGIGIGGRLTLWRFSLDAGYGDLPRYATHGEPWSMALAIRF